MVTGLRLSAGVALLGAVYAGVLPDSASHSMPVAVIGGSALTGFVADRRSDGRNLVFDIAARADETTRPVAPLGRGEALPGFNNAPTFSRIEINAEGRVRFEGRGVPGTRVTLNRHGQPFGSAVVTSRGDWQLTVEAGLTAGEHQFAAVSSQPGNGAPVIGGELRIAIPADFAGAEARSPTISGGTAGVDSTTDQTPAMPGRGPSERAAGKLEQAAPTSPPASPAPSSKTAAGPNRPVDVDTRDTGSGGGSWFWLQEWLARSNRDFQGRIVRNLQTPAPSAGDQHAAGPAPKPDDQERAKSEALAKADAAAAERAKSERIAAERASAERVAAERAAAEKRRVDEERRAAAAADARDAEAARQVEAHKRIAEAAEAKRLADAAAKMRAEDEQRAQAEREQRKKAAEDEARRLKALIEADAPRAIDTARSKLDREERERFEKALLEAEIAAKRQRAEAKARQQEAEDRLRSTREPARPALSAERGGQPKAIGKEAATEVAKAPAAPVPTRRPEREPKALVPPAVMPPPVRREAPATPPRRDSVVAAPGLRGGDSDGGARPADRPQPQPSSPPRAVVTRPDGGMALGVETRPTPAVAGHRRRVAAAGCPDAGRRITPPGTYVVRRGDSLWLISRRHYRRGALWPVIHRANDDKIDDPDLIFPCQRFFLPERPR